MNDLATIPDITPGATLALNLPADLPYPSWLSLGRDLGMEIAAELAAQPCPNPIHGGPALRKLSR